MIAATHFAPPPCVVLESGTRDTAASTPLASGPPQCRMMRRMRGLDTPRACFTFSTRPDGAIGANFRRYFLRPSAGYQENGVDGHNGSRLLLFFLAIITIYRQMR